MLAWMVYVAVVSLVLGAAAFVAERAAQLGRAPTRWVWMVSLCASVVLPPIISSVSIDYLWVSHRTGRIVAVGPIPLRQLTASTLQPSAWLEAAAGSAAASLKPNAVSVDAILAGGWGAASAAILLAIAFNSAQLYRRRPAWKLQLMAGAPVYVSDDVGPAVVGLVRPSIVLPRWIAQAEPDLQALVLAHERSHIGANDARLLAVAVLLIAAMPWNLPLWWQLRRLRFAIEMDCDARVLRAGHDMSRYGEALIAVGEQQSRGVAVVAAMSESKSFLEQRIRKMAWRPRKFAWASAAGLAGLGFVLTAGAAEVSPPNAPPFSARMMPEVTSLSPAGKFGDTEMNRYRNNEWRFAVDIPGRWNAFPPVQANSPFEVVRFISYENGVHSMIVFRNPNDPTVSPRLTVEKVQEGLAKIGFADFVTGETKIGSRSVLTLDFDRKQPNGKTWSVREYFVMDGTLGYVLGFGTTDRDAMFGLYDRMAKSFVFEPQGA